MSRAQVLFILSLLTLGACADKETSSTAADRVSPTYQGPAEAAYCASATAYGGSTITVSGTAKYIRRKIYNNPSLPADPSFEGLGSASTGHATLPAEEKPIRAAEVRVTDAGGAVVQCGRTDPATGAFSVTLPAGNTSYTVSVNSRSGPFGGTTYVHASILNKPEANQFYSLSTTVNAAGGNVNVGTLTATATTSGEMLGAAFNILDQFFSANEFLRAEVGACGIAGCTSITLSAPVRKVSAYWTKGFNPNDYFGGGGGLSFYLPDYFRLFILGGVSGDIDDADTDHFDNSVILHEYGHFLEDAMFESDSPGGSHNGNKIIDPRLAWSEGWGNFIQAAILTENGEMGAPRYYDTSGNLDGTPDLFFEVDLENMTGHDNVVDGAGEGNFREFMVSRFLLDIVDTGVAEATYPSGTDTITGEFNQLWAALTKTTGSGLSQSTLAFRNIGHMHIAQQALGGAATNWSPIRVGNYQDGNNSEYAQYVTAPNGTCNYNINPKYSATSISASNLFVDNDFFHLKIGAAGSYTITLTYQDADGVDSNEDGLGGTTAPEADLDLIIYGGDAVIGSSADLVGRSMDEPDANLATGETETVNVTLAPGDYLIQVNAYTGGGLHNAENTQYKIKLGVNDLCPASL